ncbi:MAG TPA: helix-turn-helix domain-containing protein [Vicinamibacterales bacterium]|nr:helix-turn-helix domain-containing protein [Vicinamibacterales bacterium]
MSQRNTGVTVGGNNPVSGDGPALVDGPVPACPVREVLERVSGKWSIQIVIAAAAGPIRFTELERAIDGISRRMLTLTLRSLERDGLIVRTVYPTVPPKVVYAVTPMALELHESFQQLMDWAVRHRATIAASRASYDLAAAREPAGATVA